MSDPWEDFQQPPESERGPWSDYTSPTSEPSSLLRRGVVDPLVGLAKGALVGVPETIVGLADIPTLGYAGKGVDAVTRGLGLGGFKEANRAFTNLLSPETQKAQAEVSETKGFFPTIGAAIQNPSAIAQVVAESIPPMVTGTGLTSLAMKGLGLGVKAAGITSAERLRRAILAGGIGEGAVTAGQNLEQVRQETPNELLTLGQVGANVASGAITGLIGVMGGKLAAKLGLEDINTLIAGGKSGVVGDTEKNIFKKVLYGAIQEGIFEELPQSMQEQVFQNISLGKPIGDQVLEQGAMGMLAGFAQSTGAQVGGKLLGKLKPTPVTQSLEADPLNQQIESAIAEDPENAKFVEPPPVSPEMLGEALYKDLPRMLEVEKPSEVTPVTEVTPAAAETIVPPEPEVSKIIPEFKAPAQEETPLAEKAAEAAEIPTPLPSAETSPEEKVETAPTPIKVTEEANKAATSPINNIPEPTEAQKKAGNYKMGHTTIQGLDISIENPAGSVRKGVDENGKPWETPIVYHYGYIKKTEGKDGDHVDAFIGPNPDSQTVFVVDQKDPKTGKFDEHKTLIGFNTAEEARQGYLANYDASGPSRVMGITEMSMDKFKDWLKGDTTKRVSKEETPGVAATRAKNAEVKARLTETIAPERLTIINNLEKLARSLSKKDEFASIPIERFNFTPAEQQEMVKRGMTFDVDRMGKPQIRLSKERINELREKVKAAREPGKRGGFKFRIPNNPMNPIAQAIKDSGGIAIGNYPGINVLGKGLRGFLSRNPSYNPKQKRQWKGQKIPSEHADAYKQLLKDYPGLLRVGGRTDLDTIAGEHGYESVDALINALLDPKMKDAGRAAVNAEGEPLETAEAEQDAIERETAKMFDKYGKEEWEAYQDEQRRQEQADLEAGFSVLSEEDIDEARKQENREDLSADILEEIEKQQAEGAERSEYSKEEIDAVWDWFEEQQDLRQAEAEAVAKAEPAPPKTTKESYIGKVASEEIPNIPAPKAEEFALTPEGEVGKEGMVNREVTGNLFGKPEQKEMADAGRLQTESPEFKKWFGNSKVVDENGDPLVVYRGSTSLTEEVVIDPAASFETPGAAFFSDNEDVAHIFRYERDFGEVVTEQYNEETDEYEEVEPGNLTEAYLSIQNPLILEGYDAQKFSDDTGHQGQVVRKAIADGYDGIVVRDVKEGVGDYVERGTTYAVFSPAQIKSATGNRGTFDPNNPDIRYMAETNLPGATPTRTPQGQALVTVMESLRTGEKKGGYSVSEIISKYEEATGEKFPYPTMPFLEKLGTTVSFDSRKIINKDSAAVYDPDLNQIIFNEGTLENAPDPISKFQEALAHESIHPILLNLKTLNMPAYIELQARMKGFAKELNRHLGDASYSTQRMFEYYTEKSMTDDIINLAFTNKGFAEWLNSIPSTRQVNGKSATLWGRLKDIILKAIGKVSGATKLDELNDILDTVMGDVMPEKQPVWVSKVAPLIEKKMRMKMSVPQLRAMLQKDVTQAEMDTLFAGLGSNKQWRGGDWIIEQVSDNKFLLWDAVNNPDRESFATVEENTLEHAKDMARQTETTRKGDGTLAPPVDFKPVPLRQVTKQEVLDATKMNTVEFKDVMLGRESEPDIKKRFEEITGESSRGMTIEEMRAAINEVEDFNDVGQPRTEGLPHFDSVTSKGVEGGIPGTYRELTVTMPGKDTGTELNKYIYVDPVTGEPSRLPGAIRKNNPNYSNPATQWKDQHSQYSDIANPVVRVHFDDRESNGKRILFIREMQSIAKNKPEGMPQWTWDKAYDIGVKRILAYAKENGYDGVAWSPGKIVADRYNLAKQVKEIAYEKRPREESGGESQYRLAVTAINGEDVPSQGWMNLKEIEGFVGKDIASKIEKGEGKHYRGHEDLILDGLDLEIGGEGIKDVYDRRLPGLFKKYGKEGVGEVALSAAPKFGYVGEDRTVEDVARYMNAEHPQVMYGAGKVVRAMLDGGMNFKEAMNEHQNKHLAELLGGVYADLETKITAPMIPITPNTPGSFSQYSLQREMVNLPDSMKRTIGTVTAQFTNPRTTPSETVNSMRRTFQAQGAKEFKWWDSFFSIPFRFAQKYNDPKEGGQWEGLWDVHVNRRAENRSELTHNFLKTAEDFVNLRKHWRTEGLSGEEIDAGLEKVERVITAGNIIIHERLKTLTQEIQGKKGAEFTALQKQINDLRNTGRFSDEELKSGVTDEYGEKIPPLTDREIKAYVAARKGYDLVWETNIAHLTDMTFHKYQKQKWYGILLAAAGTPMEKAETMAVLNRKGLNKAALARAQKIQVNIASVFAQLEKGLTTTPPGEIAAAGAKYDKLFTKMATELKTLQNYVGQVSGVKDPKELTQLTREVFSAYLMTRPHLKEINRLRNEAKEWPGYAPQYRDQGKMKGRLVEKFLDEDGNLEMDEQGVPIEPRQVHMEMVNNEKEAERLIEKMMVLYPKSFEKAGKLAPGYFIEWEAQSTSPEAAFQGVNDVNVQKIIDDSISNMKVQETYYDKDGNKIDVYDKLRDAAFQSIADQFKKRGAMRYTLHRNQKYGAIKGYKETGLQKVYVNYASSMAGLMTKQQAAADSLEILSKISDPEMFTAMSKWNREQLRNESPADRVAGVAKSMAFTYMLGGLLKSTVINATQPIIIGIPELKKYMREHGVQGMAGPVMLKASADVLMGKTSEMEKRFMKEAIQRGVATDQYIQSVFDSMRGKFSEKYVGVMRMLGWPFSKVEVHNRLTTLVAFSRVAYPGELKKAQEQGLKGKEAEDAAYEAVFNGARTFNNNVNYAYGKANRPLAIQSGDLIGVLGSALYTFKAFPHNLLARQAELLSQKDFRTFAHTMAYMAVFGGLMGLPFFKDFFEWFEKKFGYSPTNSIRKTLRGIGGETLETLGISGIPALLGANISGSINIGLPWPFGADNPADSVFGVMGSLAKRGSNAAQALERGDIKRAATEISPEFLRAPMTALKESEFGKQFGYQGFATNPRGNVIYDENGKPITLSTKEAILKAGGFNPTEYAREKEKNATTQRLEAWVADQKTNIAETLRIARLQKKPDAIKDAMESVRELNQKIRDRDLQKLVPLASMQRIVLASRQIPGVKQRRGAAFKRAEL